MEPLRLSRRSGGGRDSVRKRENCISREHTAVGWSAGSQIQRGLEFEGDEVSKMQLILAIGVDGSPDPGDKFESEELRLFSSSYSKERSAR
ncbi:hypothetical protein R1flu_018948 [Riccia fluitans]|uniref:Uncharacterized protein n=1 Tax=Riccia fluitans TaxID=41844 RepID=A0ABD1ZHA8_9MARC